MHLRILTAAAALVIAAAPAAAKEKLPETWDGLVEVDSRRLSVV